MYKTRKFKKNYQSILARYSPYWRGTAVCKCHNVVANLTIQNREESILKIAFVGDVKHDITKPKAKKMTGEPRAAAIEDYKIKNNTPSKHHRDKLTEIKAESFQSGDRSGAGVTYGTMKCIRAAAKRKDQFDKNLYTSISHMQHSIAQDDEDKSIRLGHKWRKCFGYICFGYIQLCNLTKDVNLVLFNEASVRLYHKLAGMICRARVLISTGV